MEKILYNFFYWLAKVIRGLFLLGGAIVVYAGLKELFATSGSSIITWWLALVGLTALGFIVAVQFLILFEDIRAGV